jgi:hypothetical protein
MFAGRIKRQLRFARRKRRYQEQPRRRPATPDGAQEISRTVDIDLLEFTLCGTTNFAGAMNDGVSTIDETMQSVLVSQIPADDLVITEGVRRHFSRLTDQYSQGIIIGPELPADRLTDKPGGACNGDSLPRCRMRHETPNSGD